MEHLIVKAQVVETEEELGVFEAVVSAWSEDRQRDVILPSAYDKTIKAWQRSGKWLPLLFEHSSKSVGEIDPESLRTTGEGLVVRGHVDQVTDEGEQTWRMIKSNTASFSVGGIFESRRRKGGGREIYEVDLLEISFTSKPAHPSARVLDWKSEVVSDWRDKPRYSYKGRLLSYYQLQVKLELKQALKEMEAEEAEAEAQTSQPQIPTSPLGPSMTTRAVASSDAQTRTAARCR